MLFLLAFLNVIFETPNIFFRASVIFTHLPFQVYLMQSVNSVSVYLLKVTFFKPWPLVLHLQTAEGIVIRAVLQR